MSIEFACENCARTLRVPAGSSGKKSQCPACGRTQEIPYVIEAGPGSPAGRPAGRTGSTNEAESSGAADAERHATGPSFVRDDGKLSIPCPNCKHHLVCSKDLLGTRGQCRNCQTIFTIATEPQQQPGAVTSGLVFSCPECHQLFEGKPEMEGRSGRCHVCSAVFPIKLRPSESAPKPAPPQPAPPQPAPPQPRIQKTAARRSERKAAPKPIQFECVQCHGLMEVPGSSAGLDTACPYCQTVQKIPAASVPLRTASARNALAPAATDGAFGGLQGGGQGNYGAAGSFETLGSQLDPFGGVNPYAAAPQSQWQAPKVTRSRSGLTIGNVFATAFENLFPTCLFSILHAMVVTGCASILGGFAFAMLLLIGSLKLGREGTIASTIVMFIVLAPIGLSLAAWFSGSIRHMALRAIRGRDFDFNKAFSPGGAFGIGIMMGLLNMLIQLLARVPQLVDAYAPGTMGPFALVWAILLAVLGIVFALSTSLVWFAAIDGDADALGTSFRLVFSNLPIMVAVKLLVWIMTVILFIPTLGLALTLPIYFNAALYDLARKAEPS